MFRELITLIDKSGAEILADAHSRQRLLQEYWNVYQISIKIEAEYSSEMHFEGFERICQLDASSGTILFLSLK